MKIPDAFTPEQQQVLRDLVLGVPSLRSMMADLNMQLGALRLALVTKGLITMDEIEAGRKETEAALPIEQATSPEWKAITGELTRLEEQGPDEPPAKPQH
jgi:hypothetical protein